jgi:hypothetical protein
MMKLTQAGKAEDLYLWIDPLVVNAVAEVNSANGKLSEVFIEDQDQPFIVTEDAERIAIDVARAKGADRDADPR